MKAVIFSLIILSVIMMSDLVSAWGPHTHTYVVDELFKSPERSSILMECLEHKDAFLAGSEIPDITVVYYFEHGGRDYKVTHNWNFQQEVMAEARTVDERCFAYGIGSHLIADAIAHEYAVPDKIISTYLPNWLVHPMVEKKYDSILVARKPYLLNKTKHMMDAVINGPKGDRYMEMVKNALGTNIGFDIDDDTMKLAYALDSFYDTQFKPEGGGMFIIYPYLDKFTNILLPFGSAIGYDEMELWVDKTVEENFNVFENWGSRYALSPHGFEQLKSADMSISNIFNYLMAGVVICLFVIPLFMIWKWRGWKGLLVFPLIIIILAVLFIAIYLSLIHI